MNNKISIIICCLFSFSCLVFGQDIDHFSVDKWGRIIDESGTVVENSVLKSFSDSGFDYDAYLSLKRKVTLATIVEYSGVVCFGIGVLIQEKGRERDFGLMYTNPTANTICAASFIVTGASLFLIKRYITELKTMITNLPEELVIKPTENGFGLVYMF